MNWLVLQGFFDQAHVETLNRFNDLYRKAMLAYGVKILNSSVISNMDSVRGWVWHLGARDEKRWRQALKILNQFSYPVVQGFRAFGEHRLTQRHLIIINQNIDAIRCLIEALGPLFIKETKK